MWEYNFICVFYVYGFPGFLSYQKPSGAVSKDREITLLCLQYFECSKKNIPGISEKNITLIVLQPSEEQAVDTDSPLALTVFAVVLNGQIASRSWTRISEESAICCHLAGLKTMTLSWKEVYMD